MALFILILAILSLASLPGCTDDQSTPNSIPPPVAQVIPAAPSPSPTPELAPLSPNVIYALGWDEMTIHANSAKTTVSIGAHFLTNRNACGKDAYGVIPLEIWNPIAKNTNLAMKAATRTSDFCTDPPTDVYPYMDGNVEVKLGQAKRILFELKDGQICTTIQDLIVSNELLTALNQLIAAADREDCPHGWGSGS